MGVSLSSSSSTNFGPRILIRVASSEKGGDFFPMILKYVVRSCGSETAVTDVKCSRIFGI